MVELRSATLELRSYKLTRSLLKQAKKLNSLGEPFQVKVGDGYELNQDYCVGYIHGSVLGDEFSLYVIFVKDGDLYLFNWPGFKPPPWCKRIYV